MSAPSQPALKLVPPFTLDTAILKVRAVEDNWNSRDPERVARAYTTDCHWRNRSEFIDGREAVTEFLKRKWSQELEYRLIKEIWAFGGNRIAVRFAYESHDAAGQWRRAYGNENWEFDQAGLSKIRHASINDVNIREEDRLFRWPLGRRPDNHPGLTALGL
jgi:nuclear transport factor 2 (NTF2) superfamily protein